MLSGGDAAIFNVRLQDDVTAPGKAMAASVKDLRANLRSLTENFQSSRANIKPLVVGMAEARKLFKDSGENVRLFSAALKDAGVSAMDSRIMLGKMTRELEANRREALNTDNVWSKMFSPKTIWVASHALNVLQKGWQGVGTAINLAQRAGAMVKDDLLDPVIESAQYRESTLISLRESLMASGEMKDKGSADKRAKEMFAGAQKLAQETPLDTKEIIDTFTSLGSAGFKSDEAELLSRIVADQSTIFGAEKGRQAIEAFGRIKANDKLQLGDFESLTAAKFSKSEIVKQLATKFGIKGKDDADVSKKVEKLISSGGVNAYTALNAVIASKEKNGAIGDVAKANADSLKGAISNVKSAFSDLLQSTDIVNWPGVVAFKAFLKQVTTSLSAESESGKELLSAVQSVTDEILGGLSNISATDLSGWIRTVGKVAIEAAQGIKKIWEWVDRLIHTEGGIGEGLKDVLADMGATIGAGILKGMATGAVKGIVGGATTAAGKLIGASGDDIVGAKDELLGYLGIGGGKDEVIEKLGDSIPKLAEGGIVRKPTLAVVGEAGPEMVIPFSRFNHDAPGMLSNMSTSSSGGRGGISISGVEINIEINGAGDMGDPDALARTLEPVVVDALISGLERHAMTTG